MTESELADVSKCYGCMDDDQFSASVVYLLNQIAGGSLTPAGIAANSACYCVPDPLAADVYLLDLILP